MRKVLCYSIWSCYDNAINVVVSEEILPNRDTCSFRVSVLTFIRNNRKKKKNEEKVVDKSQTNRFKQFKSDEFNEDPFWYAN